MANWLDKVLSPPAKKGSGNLPVSGFRRNFLPAFPPSPRHDGKIPNASLIYGVAAAVLMVLSLYFLFTGVWLTGILLMLPAGCLLGFALHYLHYS